MNPATQEAMGRIKSRAGNPAGPAPSGAPPAGAKPTPEQSARFLAEQAPKIGEALKGAGRTLADIAPEASQLFTQAGDLCVKAAPLIKQAAAKGQTQPPAGAGPSAPQVAAQGQPPAPPQATV